ALRIVQNGKLKQLAFDGVPNDVYRTGATIEELRIVFYFMMKCAGLPSKECEDFFKVNLLGPYLLLEKTRKYSEGDLEGYIRLKNGEFNTRVKIKAEFYREFYPRKKPYMEMPYLEYSDEYFREGVYQTEFAKMIVKKDYNVALEMIGHFKHYLERLEMGDVFDTVKLYFFSYILMLDRLSQMSVVESPMLDDFDRWKAKVDWRSDLSWETT
nr:hypothetical protein [Candidatus Sigynarchaeota archaeon]